MKHLKKGRKFGRTKNPRRALLRTLLFQLLTRGRIITGLAKAKEIGPMAEKLITTAKKGTLAARRDLGSHVPDQAAERLIKTIAPNMKNRHGGYTRIIKIEPRKSDAGDMAMVELVE